VERGEEGEGWEDGRGWGRVRERRGGKGRRRVKRNGGRGGGGTGVQAGGEGWKGGE